MRGGRHALLRSGALAAVALGALASKQPHVSRFPPGPDDPEWDWAEPPNDVTVEVRGPRIRGEIEKSWDPKKDEIWCDEATRESILSAIDRNRYFRVRVKGRSNVVGKWFGAGSDTTGSYGGENTLLKRGLNTKEKIAVVVHEAMHSAGMESEWGAWEPVKCLGRMAERPKPRGGGGGGGGEDPSSGDPVDTTGDDEEWWCYKLWNCTGGVDGGVGGICASGSETDPEEPPEGECEAGGGWEAGCTFLGWRCIRIS